MTASDRRIRRVRILVAIGIVVAVLGIYGPCLTIGFLADDLFQISMIDGLFGDYSPWNLYAFAVEDPASNAAHAARGSLPWWTVPNFRFSMLRPLASILIYLDHRLFPRAPFIHHIHALLWFFALLWATHRLLGRVTTPWVALAAVCAFTVDETMVWMVAWLANRCAVISAVFAMLALAVHHRRRTGEARPRDTWLEFGAWGLAFAGGEYAIGGLAYLAAYEIAFAEGRLRERVIALWPGTAALVVFAIAYVSLRCGVYGATTYIDPFDDPGQFLASASERIPRMAGEVWTGMAGETERFWLRYEKYGLAHRIMPVDGVDLLTQAHRHGRFAIGLSVVLTLPAWWWARRHLAADERRVVRWFVLGSIFSLVPIAAIPPATRSLMFANLGAAVFVGAVLVATVRAWRVRERTHRRWARNLALTLWTVVLLYVHVIREVGYTQEQVDALLGARGSYEMFYGNPAFKRVDLEGKHVVVIATPGLVTGIHGISMLALQGRTLPKTWHVFAMGQRPYLVRKLGPRSLEVDSVGGAMQLGPQEALFRSPWDALHKGDKVDIGLFAATVLHERDGKGPDAILFEFDRPLDDPSLVFLEVGDGGLRPFAIPPKGTTVAVQPPQLPHVVPRG